MKLKRYEAPSLPEALRVIRHDLGPDAIIIHTQQVRQKGLLGLFGRPVFEVIAALDGDMPQRTVERVQPAVGGRRPSGETRRLPTASAPVRQTNVRPASGRVNPLSTDSQATASWVNGRPVLPPAGTLAPGAAGPVTAAPAPPAELTPGANGAPLDVMQRDLSELKSVIGRLASQSQLLGIYKFAPSLVNLYQALLEQELDPALAQQVIVSIREELSDRALNDRRAVEDSLGRFVQRLLPTLGPLQPDRALPRVLFLIGPTGVGKTTTIAKLAANLVLDRYRVALVTTDSFRIAAIPQLETYAEIIGVPVEVAYTPADLRALVERQAGVDFVLVDTPGRSPHRADRLGQLGEFVQAVARRLVYLTISATTKYRDMLDVVERFGVIPCDGLLFTKLDETTSFGPIVNLVSQSSKPLTYLTTGQNVPTDIEVATRERLASLIVEATAIATRGDP